LRLQQSWSYWLRCDLPAVAYFAKLGIRIERVMTDNGSCYRSKTFRAACNRLRLRQIFTRPYTPKTNGKAERFIQSAFANGPTLAPTRTLINDLLS
jgi:transposase InsO family protein